MTAVTIAEESPRQPAVIRLLELSDAYAASLYPAESNHLVDLSVGAAHRILFRGPP